MTDRRAALALVLVLASGCSQSDGGSSHAPSDLAPVLGAMCDLMERCPGTVPPIASRSRDECIDIVYWALTCRVESDGVHRAPLTVEGGSVQACADFLSGLACEDFSCFQDGTCPEGAACASLFGGLSGGGDDDVAAPGEACSRYGTPRCDPEHYCAPEAYDEVSHVMVCEVCAPRLTEGATCDWYAPAPECASGLACVRASDGSGTPTCQRARAEGEACSGPQECASGFCARGATSGVCRTGGHAGDPCAADEACRSDENVTCVAGTCGPRRDLGEPCEEDDDCSALACHTDGLCGRPDGERCTGSYQCRTGYCPSLTTCTPRLADGASCSSHDACESAWCDAATGTCGPRPPPQPIGGSCGDGRECEEGLSCDGTCYRPCDSSCDADGLVCMYTGSRSECLPPQADGASCSGDEDCASGFCNDSEVCAQRPAIGDPCTGFGDCGPLGSCSGGVCVARRGPDEACEGFDSCLQPFVCMNGRCSLISLACEPAPIGQQCTALRFCAADAYCDFSSFTCVPRHREGESCATLITRDGDDCAPGLACDPATSTCRPRIAEGSACAPGDACAEGTFCIGGTCTAGPGGGECHWDEECPLETYCDDRSDTCEPFRQLGDPCQPGSGDTDLCDRRYLCDRSTAVCIERPALGEACDHDTGCREGATCSDFSSGTCVARAGVGEACASTSDPLGSACAEDLYCDSSVSPSVCARRVPLGGSCTSSESCTSRICVDGRCLARAECVLPDQL